MNFFSDGVLTTATFGAPPTTVEVKFTETPFGETLETRDTDQPRDSTTDGPESESSVTEATADLTTVGPTEVETTEDTDSLEPDVTTAPVTEGVTEGDETTPQPQEVSESDSAEVTQDDVTTPQPEEVTEGTDDGTASTGPEDTVDVTEVIPTASEGPEPSSSTSPDTIDVQTTDSHQTVTKAPVEDTTETTEGVTDGFSSTASSISVDVTTASPEEDVTETTSDSISETTVSGLDCVVGGKTYTKGETIPSPSECQENCTCAEGKLQCQVVACPPAPPAFLRCITIKEESSGCCPTYQCRKCYDGVIHLHNFFNLFRFRFSVGTIDYHLKNVFKTSCFLCTFLFDMLFSHLIRQCFLMSTATPPNPEMLSKCVQDGQKFMDGESVPSVDVCSDCFCIEGDVVCATLECSAPGPRCTPAAVPEGVCCPSSYDCG